MRDNSEPTKIIAVSASKWALFDYYTGKYIRGYRSHDINDLSVFSKLLVYCTINTLINKYSLDSTRFDMIVTPGILLNFPDNKTLNADDILSLKDLLTLMVVEESEIYEVVISVNIGAYLFKKSRGEYYSVFDVNDSKMKEHLQLFNDLVNRYSKLLHLEGVVYLQNDLASRTLKSTCCASDVAVLSIECLKIPHFMSIVTSKERSYSVRFVDQHGELQTRSGVVINKTI